MASTKSTGADTPIATGMSGKLFPEVEPAKMSS